MKLLTDIAMLLVLMAIPMLMLACSTLPYGPRYLVTNAALLTLVGFAVLQQAMAHFNELYGVAMLVYGVSLTLWTLILHTAKALKFATRRLIARHPVVMHELR